MPVYCCVLRYGRPSGFLHKFGCTIIRGTWPDIRRLRPASDHSRTVFLRSQRLRDDDGPSSGFWAASNLAAIYLAAIVPDLPDLLVFVTRLSLLPLADAHLALFGRNFHAMAVSNKHYGAEFAGMEFAV